jgi:TRAP transporter TAXI family solute receptor
MAHGTFHTTRRLMSRRAFVAAGGAALVAAPALAQMKTLSIATGGTGGVFYPLGGGMANLLSKLPGIQATAEVTGGSVDNLKLIGSGQSEIAFTQCDAAFDAINGLDKFKSGKITLRTLMVLYPNQMHAVTVEGTGISKIADLKGKRVSTGSPGSATEVMAFRVMEASGLDKDRDVKRERLGAAESVNAIKDRKIDAFFFVGGLPTSAVTDLGATPGTKLKLIDHDDAVAKMNAKYGDLYAASVIKAGTYPGQDKDNLNSVVWNILVTGGKMTDDMAYTIVKTIFDKQPDLIAVHREAENFSLKSQVKAYSTAPWHPGALKYFAERGVVM